MIGEIPGIEPGTVFASRKELYDAGVHRTMQAGNVTGASWPVQRPATRRRQVTLGEENPPGAALSAAEGGREGVVAPRRGRAGAPLCQPRMIISMLSGGTP